MPHSLSPTNRMADLRHTYTGETRSAIIPEIQARLATLDANDRALLRAAFDGNHSDTPPQRVRSAVIPDAASLAQQHLEASALDAIGRAGSHHPTLLRMVRGGDVIAANSVTLRARTRCCRSRNQQRRTPTRARSNKPGK
ncbi:hypothetical protein [Kutzneria sp. CA-103260]|uniref:hypothetical protein n=1 Tax=Kutzneria sp. CA-103260 TaxID=2802641 RepID=UPI001BA8C2C8|nr:hypothetical protein [Kutzneria sp. CA-103260]QUQ64535.1 hypothetical protein JJ691_22550 [Kutzneria sp. CA-103260]